MRKELKMKITFYKTTSDKRCITKSLMFIAEKENVKIIKNSNYITDIELTFYIDDNFDLLKESNYCYIDSFNRFYYIENMHIDKNLLHLKMHVDVLMSFADKIKNIECTITRNENLSNAYIYDSEYETLAYEQVVIKSFEKGLERDSIILLTVG